MSGPKRTGPRRYCGMCDQMVDGLECPRCGADTDPCANLINALQNAFVREVDHGPHTCHDMNPPHPYPCKACEVERARDGPQRHRTGGKIMTKQPYARPGTGQEGS